VGLLRLTLDLTRRRPELFAEIGAVEVVKGAVAPPTPGTDTWWCAVAAVREAVYALRERGLVQYVREAEVVSWVGPSC
jgi:ABC-type Zn2+ transport system substrate-binding protein/surface adhesin